MNDRVDMDLVNDLVLELRNIPHLDLGLRFDPDLMLKDYRNIERHFKFEGYNSLVPTLKEYYANKWTGISLNSEDGELYTELMVRSTENDCTNFIRTQAGHMAPNLINVMEELGGETNRARILLMAPGATIGWHCHVQDYQKLENVLIVQVPIIMPEKFKYSVINIYDYKFSDFTSFPRIESRRYPAGHAYIFNSFHYHNIFNYSNTTRVTLEFHIDVTYRKSYNIVRDAVDRYEGNYI
jgi:hypothetical protein